MYSPNKPYPVWCPDCWFSDEWNPLDYGREYDRSKPFFEQMNELWKKVPKVALIYVRSVNSEYINISADNKNCYMIVESSNNEDCAHCYWIQVCKDCVDVSFSHQTQFSYESDDSYDSYRLFYSKGCYNCLDSYFLFDCRGCSNCIGCVNLRNKQYHIFNKPYSKEDYEKFLREVRLDSYNGVELLREKFKNFLIAQPRKYSEIYNASRSTGNYITNAKNCRICFHAYDAEDNAYSVHVWRGAKGIMDCDTSGRGAEFNYNSLNAGLAASYCICTSVCWGSSFAEYSFYCHNCNNVFGSVGLRKKNYCILNKQYSKDEYEKLMKEIVNSLSKDHGYGDFFPLWMSPFGYNESSAIDQFPLAKAEAINQGFTWEDYPRGTYGKEMVKWSEVPDSIRDVGHLDVLNVIFACESCKKNYRIIPYEFEFYKKLDTPLPRLCPDCRHTRRFTARGPNRLWHRQCMCDYAVYSNTVTHKHHSTGRCPNEFETSYASDRKEIVYCEQCYNSEVV
ncbi:hypothetical protein HY967_04580 [Candidatus Jorgensenbacteria bacterium]|nr:hypothetical protein [Candidatus Jorgensenbacteria bacterium]